MARWQDVVDEEPDFATQARKLLELHKHRTLATLRRDGAPRISGTEIFFADGDIWFGAMWRSRKALDLRRDPRFALHGPTVDPSDWPGDAKLAGRAEEVDDSEMKARITAASGAPDDSPYHLFRADLNEVVITRVDGDELLIEHWRPGRGVTSVRRK